MPSRECTCPRDERSLGSLYGISMGRGRVRLSTTAGCPEHDSCHGYTAAVRAARPSWSRPWCPKHHTRDCPASAPDGTEEP
jgi:hypothetical protein